MSVIEQWQDRFNEAATPTRAEVIAAKRLILERLDDGNVHDRGELLTVSARPQLQDRQRLTVTQDTTVEQLRNEPTLHDRRVFIAAAEALAELDAAGIAVPHDRDPGGWNGEWSQLRTIGIQVGNTGTSVTLSVPVAAPAPAYRLHAAMRASGLPRPFDGDLFAADLAQLNLDPRTVRCIVEALDAYGRGLYLAAANLLGAAVEGAWFAAAEAVAPDAPSVAQALEEDRPKIGKVQKAMLGWMKAGKAHRETADDLESHANHVRELRNYGAHPRSELDHHLEDHFTEVAAALLIMGTHRHLRMLAEVAAGR